MRASITFAGLLLVDIQVVQAQWSGNWSLTTGQSFFTTPSNASTTDSLTATTAELSKTMLPSLSSLSLPTSNSSVAGFEASTPSLAATSLNSSSTTPPAVVSQPTSSTNYLVTSASSTKANVTSSADMTNTFSSSVLQSGSIPIVSSADANTTLPINSTSVSALPANLTIASTSMAVQSSSAQTSSAITNTSSIALAAASSAVVASTMTTSSELTTSSSTNGSTTGPSLTSTITALPSGASIETLNITEATTNGWYTTTKDSQTTILPVIWRPRCGNSGGSSILIWDFPVGLTGTLVDLTSLLPQLPKISFSCIKVFGVTVGDCPPAEDDTEADDDDVEDKQSSSSTSASTETSTSSTKSESCTQTTASDCRVGCSVSHLPTGSSSTTVCYTTSCFSTVGCSVQATATTTVSTSSGSRRGLTQNPTPYNMRATWSSLGMDASPWFLGAMIPWTDTDTFTAIENTTQSASGTTTASSDSAVQSTSSSSVTNSTAASTIAMPTTTASIPSTTKASEQTVSNSSTTSSTITSVTEETPWCYVHGDSSDSYFCQCGEGANAVTSPIVSGACPYISHAVTSASSVSTTEAAALPGTTTTTYPNGVVQECTSYSNLEIGVAASACVGSTIFSPSPSATPKCDTDRTSSRDKLFWIRGKNWDELLGDGDIFKASLAECSGHDVDDWEFISPLNDGSPYDFMAKGSMKGVDGCYEQAALDSGGCLVGGRKTMPE